MHKPILSKQSIYFLYLSLLQTIFCENVFIMIMLDQVKLGKN